MLSDFSCSMNLTLPLLRICSNNIPLDFIKTLIIPAESMILIQPEVRVNMIISYSGSKNK